MHSSFGRGLAALSLTVIFLQACSRPLKSQEACNFVRNNELQRVSWKGQLPVRIALHTSVPVEAYGAIDRAVAEYNDVVGHGKKIIEIVRRGAGGDLDPRQDGLSMIYWYDTWDGTKPGEQARTTIYWVGTQIFEADMRINAKNFRYYFGTATSFSDLDLDSLVLHELGHVLGLAHNVTSGSIMNITLDDGQPRRDIGDVDVASLRCEY